MNADVVYEVNLFVKREIEADYRIWLVKHIGEILALPGFLDASCFDVLQNDDNHAVAICVQYRLDSQASLDRYFDQHASRLRADGINRFGDGFSATRRVLVNAKRFSP